MKNSTIEKIEKANGAEVRIGRYAYKLNTMTYKIMRCKTEDIGRMWIDNNGNQFDGWEIISKTT